MASSFKATGILGIALTLLIGCVTNSFTPKPVPISDVATVNATNFASLFKDGFSVLINSLLFPIRETVSIPFFAFLSSLTISFNKLFLCFFNSGVDPFLFISEIKLSALSVKVNFSVIPNFSGVVFTLLSQCKREGVFTLLAQGKREGVIPACLSNIFLFALYLLVIL